MILPVKNELIWEYTEIFETTQFSSGREMRKLRNRRGDRSVSAASISSRQVIAAVTDGGLALLDSSTGSALNVINGSRVTSHLQIAFDGKYAGTPEQVKKVTDAISAGLKKWAMSLPMANR